MIPDNDQEYAAPIGKKKERIASTAQQGRKATNKNNNSKKESTPTIQDWAMIYLLALPRDPNKVLSYILNN